MKIRGLFIMMIALASTLLSGCATSKYSTGDHWDRVEGLIGKADYRVSISADNEKYAVGDDISFDVESPKSGRVWLVMVDAEDAPQLIFPNQVTEKNKIKGGTMLTVPPDGAEFNLVADKPRGHDLVAVFVTEADVTIEDMKDILGARSVEVMKDRMSEASGRWGAGSTVIRVR